MLFAFSFTLFKDDIALRLCRWVLVSQGQRIGPRREERRRLSIAALYIFQENLSTAVLSNPS